MELGWRSRTLGLTLAAALLVAVPPPLVRADGASATATQIAPPVAAKRPKFTVTHGERRGDDYYWLREKTSPEVRSYLEAENAYAERMLAPTRGLQESLYKEMLGRIKETDLSVPYREGSHLYYYRTEQGKQYRVHCRRKDAPGAAEEITVDLNALAAGNTFMGLGEYTVSPDGNLLAYSTDSTGFRVYTLHLRDLQHGVDLPDTAEDVDSAAWASDSRTLFYTTKDKAKRPYRLWRHQVGDKKKDSLVYEEKDELFTLDLSRTRSSAFLLLNVASHTTSETRYLPAGRPDGAWKVVSPRRHEREYDVDHNGDTFYIRVNDTGRNFRLVSAPAGDPSESNWKEILPHRADVMLEQVDVFSDHWVAWERRNGLPEIHVTDMKSGTSSAIELPEPVYDVAGAPNRQWETSLYRYTYQSLVSPPSVLEYDLRTGRSVMLKQEEVLGGYEPARYESRRLHATTKDGVKIPASLIHGKDTPIDGTAPMLLTGYGAYGSSFDVSFSSNRLSLLDRGFVFAIAHIRGGGEMGKAWHDQGRMMNKVNTFTDFITVAEFLIGEKYASKERLVIEGGSAGGLLMGAVTNMRPDLFKAVVNHVPFVDVINTMLDASLPLTAGEFEEWGNPAERPAYDYMKAYCPYTNVEKKPYPAILVKTSFNDSQVMYWEPAKYVAKLRATKTDSSPLIFVTNMGAGHGGASGRYDKLREIALDYAFMLQQAGVTR